MAELLLRHAMGQRESAPGWEVSSAGTLARDGHRIDRVAERVVQARGVATDGFRSRRLTSAMVLESDVILTAERSHRAAVVTLVPDALHRTFTLLQFARLLRAGESLQTETGGIDDPAVLVDIARRARSLSQPGDDDLVDPVGLGRRQVEAAATRIEAALTTVLDAFDVRTGLYGRALPDAVRLRTG